MTQAPGTGNRNPDYPQVYPPAQAYPPAQPPAPPYPPAGYQVPAPAPSGRDILRMGLWNYASNRWAPKNKIARFVVEMVLLLAFFLALAIMVRLSQG
jgi:hypothetical protein